MNPVVTDYTLKRGLVKMKKMCLSFAVWELKSFNFLHICVRKFFPCSVSSKVVSVLGSDSCSFSAEPVVSISLDVSSVFLIILITNIHLPIMRNLVILLR